MRLGLCWVLAPVTLCFLSFVHHSRTAVSGKSQFLSNAPDARFRLAIEESLNAQVNIDELNGTITGILNKFESSFWKVESSILLKVTSADCLRTGYNFSTKTVAFCFTENTVAGGTQSVDTVSHEIFHALLCAKKPELCSTEFLKDEENTALHEALADIFSYSYSPDDHFGELLYRHQPWLREYRTNLCYSLTAGAHAKGNSLGSLLLKENTSLDLLKDFLLSDEFSVYQLTQKARLTSPCIAKDGSEPLLSFEIDTVPVSKRHRYRIPATGASIAFVPNSSTQKIYTNLSVTWKTEDDNTPESFHFIRDGADLRFRIIPIKKGKSEKLIAKYINSGKIIGFDAFYFSKQM
jgi:hypothetical protein